VSGRAPAVLAVDLVDPTGVSGLTVDARVFSDLQVDGRFAPSGIRAAGGILEYPEASVLAALETAMADDRVRGARVGVHGGAGTTAAIARVLAGHPGLPVVVSSSLPSHGETAGPSAVWTDAFRHFGGVARVVVVGVSESAAAAGRAWSGLGSARGVAEAIRSRGVRAVVVTGIATGSRVVDVLDDGGEWVALDGPRVEAPRIPGLPGTFAAALAVGLAAGRPLPDAVRGAQGQVVARLRLAAVRSAG
jgi:hydroxymethylpyrimidine/phosphomethylpyrimidine kinase